MAEIIEFSKVKLAREVGDKLKELGWSASAIRSDEAGIVFYLYDVDSRQLKLIQLPNSAVELVEKQRQVDSDQITHATICGDLGVRMGRDLGEGVSDQVDNELAYSAMLYALGTKVYDHLKRTRDRKVNVGFFILRYFDKSLNDWVLRPAATPMPGILGPKEAYEAINHILSIDHAQHPERFN